MNARLNSQLIGYELEVQRMSDYNKCHGNAEKRTCQHR